MNVSPRVTEPIKTEILPKIQSAAPIQGPVHNNVAGRINRTEQVHVPTPAQATNQVKDLKNDTPNIGTEKVQVRGQINGASRLHQSQPSHTATATQTPMKLDNATVHAPGLASERVRNPSQNVEPRHVDLSHGKSTPKISEDVKPGPGYAVTRVKELHRTSDGSFRFGTLPATVNAGHDHSAAHGIGHPPASTTERLHSGHLDHLVQSDVARHVDLKKQFQFHEHGDLARRLNLSAELKRHGGWHQRLAGPISPVYTKRAFGNYYAGPGIFPHYCWYPHWSPWVKWCWNFTCRPYYDPRPIFCQPVVYAPCQAWTGWNYPAWSSLPVVSCGTWVDVPDVALSTGVDVQLLAVRFVDPGHPEQRTGPRYRVWYRNNSSLPVDQPFDLAIYASNEQRPGIGLPEAGVRVTGMESGQIQAVDLRLPFEANILDRDPQGRKIPFRYLHLIADSRRELADVDPANNGAVLDRLEILPVDPAIFSAALDYTPGGIVIDVAGEGLGPEAGQVVVQIGTQELTPEILGWCDMGVQVRLPNLPLSESMKAEILVLRGDNAASNPLPVKIPPETTPDVVPNPVP